jgi:hypothetical protein
VALEVCERVKEKIELQPLLIRLLGVLFEKPPPTTIQQDITE